METTLITAGIACIIASIVGGGLKAFSIEIHVLESGRRQAALGAFGAVLLAAGFGWSALSRAAEPAREAPPSAPAVSGRPPSPAASASAATAECSSAWFADPPPARVIPIESGTAAAELVRPDQPKDGQVVVVMTDNAKPVGAVAFRFFASNDLFKITHVVDATCAPIETFRNESRGGDPRVLQNWDTVEVTLGTARYALRLGYDSGTIGASFGRV
jgi:hypothetical protein